MHSRFICPRASVGVGFNRDFRFTVKLPSRWTGFDIDAISPGFEWVILPALWLFRARDPLASLVPSLPFLSFLAGMLLLRLLLDMVKI